MPGKRLKDVLDDIESPNAYSDIIHTKFILLLQRIEATNPNIDDVEFRWVEHKIEEMDDGYTPTKNDLLTANLYWKKWENK